ncbi:hypothetical protein ACTWQJ_49770, partial [Streptomyces sp. KR55]
LESAGEPAEAAALIDEAGGRTAALAEAHRHIAAADAALTDVPLQARAVAELRALLDFLVRRDLQPEPSGHRNHVDQRPRPRQGSERRGPTTDAAAPEG